MCPDGKGSSISASFQFYMISHNAWACCVGTCQDCDVEDITLQPIRLVLCEKTNRVSKILSKSVNSQTLRGSKYSKRRECTQRLEEVSVLNR